MQDFRENEITPSAKQKLAWSLLGRIASQIVESVSPAILHPGGGQYECLSLIGDNDNVLVMMNLMGQSTSSGSNAEVFTNTWNKAGKDISGTAIKITKKLQITTDTGGPALEHNNTVSIAASLFELHLEDPSASIEWAWTDAQDGGGDYNFASTLALEPFQIPESWKSLAAPCNLYGWQAWLWVVRYGEMPHSVVNLKSGEVLYKDGTRATTFDAMSDLYDSRMTNGTKYVVGSEIPIEVQETIKHYVYALRDPRDKQVFYIGKGVGNRVLQHKKEANDNPESQKMKLSRIQDIQNSGFEVEHFFLRTAIETEKEAFAIEQAVIDSYDLAGLDLTNVVKGHHSSSVGLAAVHDLFSKHAAKPLGRVTFPFITLNLNAFWKTTLTPEELYLEARKYWKVGDDARRLAKYAVVVSYGVVRAVYRINAWVPTDEPSQVGKWEFFGESAPEMGFMLGASLKETIKQGDANSYHKYLDGYTPPNKQFDT
jgi:hypothetical protein